VEKWNFIKKETMPEIPRGHYAQPDETPCPKCGRTDGWRKDGPDDVFLTLSGTRYYCECDGATIFYPGLEAVTFGGVHGPRMRAEGCTFEEKERLWLKSEPKRFGDDCYPESLTIRCDCGRDVVLGRNKDFSPIWNDPEENLHSHSGFCECGIVYTADVKPKEREGYSQELAAWKAKRPITTESWAELPWIVEEEYIGQ